ncbi:MAG: PKD domain-containing protein, partial [Candidatus Bipolaricaulota bacterium]
GDIDTYTWYPMSEQSEGVTLSGETATYTYTQTGSFTVELEVEDSEGSAMYGRSLEVEAS